MRCRQEVFGEEEASGGLAKMTLNYGRVGLIGNVILASVFALVPTFLIYVGTNRKPESRGKPQCRSQVGDESNSMKSRGLGCLWEPAFVEVD